MADNEMGFNEVFAPDGSLVSSTQVTRDKVLNDAEIRVLRQNCRDILTNASVPLWGRALARAVLGLTWEPAAPQPPAQNPRRLDAEGYDIVE